MQSPEIASITAVQQLRPAAAEVQSAAPPEWLGRLDSASLGPHLDNVVVHRYIPQRELLPHCHAVITYQRAAQLVQAEIRAMPHAHEALRRVEALARDQNRVGVDTPATTSSADRLRRRDCAGFAPSLTTAG